MAAEPWRHGKALALVVVLLALLGVDGNPHHHQFEVAFEGFLPRDYDEPNDGVVAKQSFSMKELYGQMAQCSDGEADLQAMVVYDYSDETFSCGGCSWEAKCCESTRSTSRPWIGTMVQWIGPSAQGIWSPTELVLRIGASAHDERFQSLLESLRSSM